MLKNPMATTQTRMAVSRSPKVGLPLSEKLGVRHSDS